MDNNAAPTNGLDLNPDMMTTQTGVPSVSPPPSANTPPVPAGVIDITPGAPDASISPTTQHIDLAPLPEPKVESITPAATPDSLTHLSDISPQVETSSPVPASPVTTTPSVTPSAAPVTNELPSSGVIDITPTSNAPVSDGLTHLSDIAPQSEVTAATPVSSPSVTTDAVTPPAVPVVSQTTPVNSTPVAPAAPATSSPLAEDPDLVKLAK
jgi:hypothetical protein